MKRVSRKIDDKALEMIRDGMSIAKTAKELGIDAQTLSQRLQKRGLMVLKDGKKFVDSKYFSEINTSEKAYWLGMMAADGTVGSNGKDIELSLKIDDKTHIEKFKIALGSKHIIGEKTIKLNDKEYKAARITIRDAQLNSDLCKHGVGSNKSLITRFPFSIPKEFYKDFIRGYFDGDGSIYSYNQANGKLKYEIAISTGSIDMVNDLIEVVAKETGLYLKFRKARTCYDVRLYNQDNIKTFLTYLYKDASIFLDRKYELYTFAVSSQSYRRDESIRVE